MGPRDFWRPSIHSSIDPRIKCDITTVIRRHVPAPRKRRCVRVRVRVRACWCILQSASDLPSRRHVHRAHDGSMDRKQRHRQAPACKHVGPSDVRRGWSSSHLQWRWACTYCTVPYSTVPYPRRRPGVYTFALAPPPPFCRYPIWEVTGRRDGTAYVCPFLRRYLPRYLGTSNKRLSTHMTHPTLAETWKARGDIRSGHPFQEPRPVPSALSSIRLNACRARSKKGPSSLSVGSPGGVFHGRELCGNKGR